MLSPPKTTSTDWYKEHCAHAVSACGLKEGSRASVLTDLIGWMPH